MYVKLTTQAFNLELGDNNTNAHECGKLFREVIDTINSPSVTEPKEQPRETLEMSYEGEWRSNLTRPRRKITESPSSNKPTVPEERMKLVFFICPHCGDTFCRMININNPGEIICKKCDREIPLDVNSLNVGSYICPDCNSVGKFLMQPEVTKVKCKGCDNMFYMIQDSETKEYEGKVYK